MGLEQAKVGSFLNNAKSTFDQLTTVAQGLLCIPPLLGKFLTGKSLAGLTEALLGSIGAVASNIVNTIIQNEIATVGNLISQTLRQQFEAIQSVLNTFSLIFQTVKNLFSKVNSTIDFIKSTENCAYAASTLASCIISSAANLQKQIKKPAGKLQQFNDKLTQAITSKSGIINNYATSNLKAVDKAKIQLNMQNFL
jgi:methyl-accepting chemotaxis protein